jgi:hypothetical protein
MREVHAPSDEIVDECLAELLELLEERASFPLKITRAEAMEFARNAYFRGYMDSLRRPADAV